MFLKTRSKELNKFLKNIVKDLLCIPIKFITEYDLDIHGTNKMSFYLEEELDKERKTNFDTAIIKNEVIVFDICKDTEQHHLTDYFDPFEKTQKDEVKRRIFEFHHLITLYENFVSPKRERRFLDLYTNLYSYFKEVKYDADKNYNLDGMEFFNIKIRVKVRDKMLKKHW